LPDPEFPEPDPDPEPLPDDDGELATLLICEIIPGVVFPAGSVIVTGSPSLTSDWREASRAMLTTGVVDDAVATTVPDEAGPPSTAELPSAVISAGPGTNTAEPRLSVPVGLVIPR
jgi:hypothetical protein